MWLIQADLERFRNLKKQRVSFHPRYNLVLGKNAQGKTNLLEAIGYLGTLRSFRGSPRFDLICHGEETCRVAGEVGSGRGRTELSFTLDSRGRAQFVDGKRSSALEDYLSRMPAVSFIPEDVTLVGGSPARRRRMLDRAVFGLARDYLREYRRYHHTLRQRNALLRRRGGSEGELLGWSKALAETGSLLIFRRLALLSALAPALSSLGKNLGLGEGLVLAYRSSFPLPPEPDLKSLGKALGEALAAGRARERGSRCTLAGPHRDDLAFLLGDRDLSRWGSQGQKRGAVLALTLAFVRLMGEQGEGFPLVLLDDVASELDEGRRRALGEVIGSMTAQFFISMTGDTPLFLDGSEGHILLVEEGGVKARPMEAMR